METVHYSGVGHPQRDTHYAGEEDVYGHGYSSYGDYVVEGELEDSFEDCEPNVYG